MAYGLKACSCHPLKHQFSEAHLTVFSRKQSILQVAVSIDLASLS